MNVGLFRLGLGIEHGNEKFRKEVLRRGATNQTIIDNLKILNKLDLPFSVNNIIGFPGETRDLAMDTVEINRSIDADSVNAYSFSPFHGTPLRTLAEKLGYIAKTTLARSVTRPTMLTMPQFPAHEIEGIKNCFVLYINLPKERWPEIRKAEAKTSEGYMIWNKLREEVAEKYEDKWGEK